MFPLFNKYVSSAETGQRSLSVLPKTTRTPTAPWSVFDLLMFKEMTLGDSLLSTAMSLNDKCMLGSYLVSFSTVISPDLQNEKKVVREAAHNMMESKDWSRPNQLCCIFRKIIGVIGNLAFGGFPSFPRSAFTPLRT